MIPLVAANAMPTRRPNSGRNAALCGIFLIAAGLRTLYVLQSAPMDDAFITYRYARNLASGLGLTYNPGERVLGTTTPLFALLLTPFSWILAPLNLVALVLSVLADVAVCAVVYRMLEAFGRGTALAAAAVYALFYAVAAGCGNGMETQLFQLLAAGSMLAASRDRLKTAALLAGVAALTRPEGVLVFGIILLVPALELRPPRRLPVPPLLVFLAVTVPWLLFAGFYFGSPVPNSVMAKASQTNASLGDWARFFFLRNPLLLLFWAAAAAGAVWGRRDRAVRLLTAWAIVYPLFFALARPPFFGAWYFPPVGFALAGLAATGSVETLRYIARNRARAAIATVAAWAILNAIAVPRSIATNRWTLDVADRVYRPMARWVAENAKSDDLVEVSDIGYVGYLSGRRILDSSGLVSPSVWQYKKAHPGNPDSDVEFLLSHRPEILLLPIRWDIYTRFRRGGILSVYRAVARFQVNGETDLDPPDPGPRYAAEHRFVADFIAFRRID